MLLTVKDACQLHDTALGHAMRSCTRRFEAGAEPFGDEVLGGHDSPAGSCAWHVLGCGQSVREWALHQGRGGRPVRQEQAQGMLVTALGLLAVHYGLAGRS
jgi:hypothetical protein